MIKVLVVTLYCGENEYEQCCESVKEQQGLIIKHIVIKNLPKQEAHQKLYKLFNDFRSEYDYLAKLDADMAFSNPKALLNIIKKFEVGRDIVSATVHDGITNTDMQSFNVFSNSCYFHFNSNDPLFTDRLNIDFPGSHYSYIDNDRNVLHAFNPSPFQAFMFGVHRALKVVQLGTKALSINNSYHQKRILSLAYANYINNDSLPSKYALIGATAVMKGKIKSPSLYQKTDFQDVFDSTLNGEPLVIDPRLESSSLISLIKVIGLYRFLLGGCRLLVKRSMA